MILSFQGLVEAFAACIGGQILGVILQIAGFDGNAAAQTASALTWIENSATVLPMIFMVIAIIALYKYPLRREHSHNAGH
jgi:Na+/melibiose symporter and related transporters